MINRCRSATHANGRRDLSAKLRAALEYLGDRLATHRASRFKPAKRYVLEEWVSARQAARQSPSVQRRRHVAMRTRNTRT